MTLAGASFLTAISVAAVLALQTPPQKFIPEAARASDLVVKLELAGTMPTHANPTSPTGAGSSLLLIDQGQGLYRWTGSSAEPLLLKSSFPAAVKPVGTEPLLNVAANKAGSTVFVMFLSTSVPRDVPRHASPRPQSDAWYLLYGFDFDGVALTRPRPIVALQARSEGHTGGGLVVQDGGAVLFSAGDNGDSYEDGNAESQNLANHLAKIVRIDPSSGAVAIAAVGVRNSQRLVIDGSGSDARLVFVSPGGWVSEELNSIVVSQLGSDPLPNFGWGRATSDGRSREGTFFIDRVGNSVARIPANEPGFIDPVAEFGREGATFVAISGPVASRASFSRITWLFGDLVSGSVYAITGPLTEARQPVYRVKLVDGSMQPVTLRDLTRTSRADLRFFNFPDGTAGLLLEQTGNFYRLTEAR